MVTLEAQRSVHAERDSAPRLSRRVTIAEPAAPGESGAIVAAMSRALAKFAGKLANALAADAAAPAACGIETRRRRPAPE